MIALQSGSGLGSLAVELAIGAVVVVFVIGGFVLASRRGWLEPETADDDGGDREDLADAANREDYRIPYRRRIKTWSGPMKVFVASLMFLSVGIVIFAYQVLKTGSPMGKYLTREVRYGLIALVGIGGGVVLARLLDVQIGHLTVIYERAGEENIVDRVPYAKTGVRRRDGKVTVPEISDNRLLGLLWRYRQRGEDRRLRGGEKPVEDVIRHQVPGHGVEIPDGSGFHVTTREDGDEILDGASASDITYSSPNSLSNERATQLREERRRKEAELQAVKATNAQLFKQVKDMRKKIENEEYEDKHELIEEFERFSEIANNLSNSFHSSDSRNGHKDGESEGQEVEQ